MSPWSKWIHRALTPTPEEIERVKGELAPAVLETVIEATRPRPDEVARLIANRAAHAQRFEQRRRQRMLLTSGGLALAGAAAATLAFVAWPQGYGTLEVAMNAPVQLSAGMLVELGPSIDLSGDAEVEVLQADANGTRVALLEGTSEWSVDPKGDYRHLVVVADDVEVEVKGTVFTVTRDAGQVAVAVQRGKVEVRHGGEVAYVTPADGTWTSVPQTAVVALERNDSEPAAAQSAGSIPPLASGSGQPVAPDVSPPTGGGIASPSAPAGSADLPTEGGPAPTASGTAGDDPTAAFAALQDRYDAGKRDGLADDLAAHSSRWPDHATARTARELRADLAYGRDNAAVVDAIGALSAAELGDSLLYKRANAYRTTGDCASAVQDFDLVMKRRFRYVDAALYKAECHIKLGQADEAATVLDAAALRDDGTRAARIEELRSNL